MAINFPTSKDTSITTNLRPGATDPMTGGTTYGGPETIDRIYSEIEALEVKVGINTDPNTSSFDYKLSTITGSNKAASQSGTEVLTNKDLSSGTNTFPIVLTQEHNTDGSHKFNWATYSPTATGWTTPTSSGRYRTISKGAQVQVTVTGTSNTTGVSITLPVAIGSSAILTHAFGYAKDNGVDCQCMFELVAGATTITVYKVVSATNLTGTWTNSGTKSIFGFLNYEIN